FTLAQIILTVMLREIRRYLRWNVLFSGMDLADGGEQVASRHGLEQERASACCQGAAHFRVAFIRRQYRDACFRKLRPNCDHRVDAADIGEPEVHEGDIGVKVAKILDRFVSGDGLRYQLHVGLALEHTRKSLAKQGVVFYNQDSYPSRGCHVRLLTFRLKASQLWISAVAEHNPDRVMRGLIRFYYELFRSRKELERVGS